MNPHPFWSLGLNLFCQEHPTLGGKIVCCPVLASRKKKSQNQKDLQNCLILILLPFSGLLINRGMTCATLLICQQANVKLFVK